MPAYEYLCNKCGVHFERRQKMSEVALQECPDCGGAVKRLISGGAGAISKGVESHPCASGGPCCGGGMCNPGMGCAN